MEIVNKITSFVTKYWKHPIAIALYIAIAIYLIYKYGKGKGDSKPSPLPGDTNWGSGLTETESSNIRRITERLQRDMSSFQVSIGIKERDVEIYKQFLSLSDKEFVGVSNDFNDLYYTDDNGNLYQWIYDESFSYTLGASNDLRETILEKMEKHNLK